MERAGESSRTRSLVHIEVIAIGPIVKKTIVAVVP
jgi:hypothetical protein